MKKPRLVHVAAQAVDTLANPDALSCQATVFRNGGNVNGRDAVAFVELTPELLAWLRAQRWEAT
jgi:hypothetical protein